MALLRMNAMDAYDGRTIQKNVAIQLTCVGLAHARSNYLWFDHQASRGLKERNGVNRKTVVLVVSLM